MYVILILIKHIIIACCYCCPSLCEFKFFNAVHRAWSFLNHSFLFANFPRFGSLLVIETGLSIGNALISENSSFIKKMGKLARIPVFFKVSVQKRPRTSKRSLITVGVSWWKIGQLDGQLADYSFFTKRQGGTPSLKPSISRLFCSNLECLSFFSQYAMRCTVMTFFVPLNLCVAGTIAFN